MNGAIHINRPSSTRFQARVRLRGRRRYKLVGKPTKSLRVALIRMAKEFAAWSMYKRGDVLVTADYYESSQVAEICRR